MTRNEDKIFVGDVGTAIIIDIGEDTTDLISAEIVVKKPNGTVVRWPASKHPTELTKIYYVSQAGDFDQPGPYQAQVHAVFPDWNGSGDIDKFKVYPTLDT